MTVLNDNDDIYDYKDNNMKDDRVRKENELHQYAMACYLAVTLDGIILLQY